MAMAVYKPGQGYWTRLMSAVGAGILVAAGVEWVWTKLTAVNADWIIFVQAGAAIVLLAAFGLIIFQFVGTRPRTCDFLIATEGEMKKVNWPNQEEVLGATGVVVACIFLLTALLFLADSAFFLFFESINVIHTK